MQIIGTVLRGKAHAEGLRHRAVYCLLYNREGRLLLQASPRRWPHRGTALVPPWPRSREVLRRASGCDRRQSPIPSGATRSSPACVGTECVTLGLPLQRRSERKKIGPGLWDLSVAEHLNVGEGYRAAAQRGLREELGVLAAVTLPPLNDPHPHEVRVPSLGVVDREYVQSFEVREYDGEVCFDTAEVSEVKWVDTGALLRDVGAHPERYTEWFLRELATVPSLRASI